MPPLPAGATAVPVTPSEFDPHNPAARGYDARDPAFARARRAACEDAQVAWAFDDELDRETARFRRWRRAPGREPFRPTAPDCLLARARVAAARAAAWRSSGEGRLAQALSEVEASAQAVQREAASVRGAVVHGAGRNLRERDPAFWSFLSETFAGPGVWGQGRARLEEEG